MQESPKKENLLKTLLDIAEMDSLSETLLENSRICIKEFWEFYMFVHVSLVSRCLCEFRCMGILYYVYIYKDNKFI